MACKESLKKAVNRLKGGDGDRTAITDVSPTELARGIKEEKEHTDSIPVRTEIAVDHLTKDPKYYTKLATIEKATDPKFESCVQQVKEKHGVHGKVNPWAVCHAALKKAQKGRQQKVAGWTEDDARSMLKDVKIENMAKSDIIDFKTRLKRKIEDKKPTDKPQSVSVVLPRGEFHVHFVHGKNDPNPISSVHRVLENANMARALTDGPTLQHYLDKTHLIDEALAEKVNHIVLHIPEEKK